MSDDDEGATLAEHRSIRFERTVAEIMTLGPHGADRGGCYGDGLGAVERSTAGGEVAGPARGSAQFKITQALLAGPKIHAGGPGPGC